MKEKRYFNVRLEFDKRKLEQTIEDAIKEGTVGYVCSVESNNLTVANNNPEFLKVLNRALVNNCDGSVLAKILGYIHHEPLESYIGADIFIKYVRMCRYRQFFLGNTPEVLSGLKDNLSKIDPEIKKMRFETLPFRKVEGGNLAASKIRNLECPNYEICLIDYGCGKFNRKIHIMEQYP